MKMNRILRKMRALVLILALTLSCCSCGLLDALRTPSHIRVDFDSLPQPETVTTFFTDTHFNRVDVKELVGLLFGDNAVETNHREYVSGTGADSAELTYTAEDGSFFSLTVRGQKVTLEDGYPTGDIHANTQYVQYMNKEFFDSELLHLFIPLTTSGFTVLNGHVSEQMGENVPEDPVMISSVVQAEALMDSLAYHGYERTIALRYDTAALKELNRVLNFLDAETSEPHLDGVTWYYLRYSIVPESLPAGAVCPNLTADFLFDGSGRLLAASMPPEIEFTPRTTMPAMSAAEAYKIISASWDTPDQYMVFDAEFLLLQNGRYVWRFFLVRDRTDRLSDEMQEKIRSAGFKGQLEYMLPCVDAGDGDRYSPFNGIYLNPVISRYNMPELFD